MLTACSNHHVFYGDMCQVDKGDSTRQDMTFTINVKNEQDNSYSALIANTAYDMILIARFNTRFRHETLPLRIKIMKVETHPDGKTAITRISLATRTEINIREFHGKALGDTNMDTSTVETRIDKFNLVFNEPGQYKIILSLDPEFNADGLLAVGLELIKPNENTDI